MDDTAQVGEGSDVGTTKVGEGVEAGVEGQARPSELAELADDGKILKMCRI